VSERDTQDGEGKTEAEPVVPTAEESWRRHLGILDLIREIREASARKRAPDAPPRSR
jgi:hypothetical protein